MQDQIIKIATRKSPLALWQANYVKSQLLAHHANLKVELVPMVTQGDVLLDSPLSKIGGKGLFVKQLELALLNNEADIAVHSMKDVPADFPEGLALTTICPRDEIRDAFISNRYNNLDELPKNAIVGTSSLRRQCQLKARYPHIITKDLRGNVGSRLGKLDNNEYDAIILAAVGLKRLELSDRIKQYIPIEIMIPAVGQGAVGIETRENDERIQQFLAPLDDQKTRYQILAERAMNRQLEGGCQVPIACHSILGEKHIELQGLVGSLDGKNIIKAKIRGNKKDAEKMGIALANDLLKQGADKILQALIEN